MNLDGFALPVKKLKGTDPIETLDLSGKNLIGVSILGVSSETLDLSGKNLIGVSILGVSSAVVIASLIGVNGALTKLSLAKNKLGEKGTEFLCDALVCNNTLKELDLSGDNSKMMGHSNIGDGTAGAKHVAKMLLVNGALTRVDVRHNNIAGDGAEQLSAAVFSNLKIEMFNKIPIKEMRANSLTELDLNGKGIGVEGGMVVAGLIPVMGTLTSVDLRGNKLRDKGWGAIFVAVCSNKDSKIIAMDASSENISPAGVKLIAEVLRMSVTGVLTVTNLLGNECNRESAKLLAEVAKQKGISLCGIQRDQTTADFGNQNLKPPDAILLASDLSQAVVTGGLTELSIKGNWVGDEGVGAICKAIKSNKETKLASLNFKNIGIGLVGANAVAAMVAVAGVLTKLSLAQNKLEVEGTMVICEALEQNTTLKELDISGGYEYGGNIGGSVGAKHVAKMLGVNGALTSIDLYNNKLCGLDWEGKGIYTAEGITAIANALRVNGGLTKMRYVSPQT